VDVLAAHLAGREQRGLSLSSIDEVSRGVALSSVLDTDANRVNLIGNISEACWAVEVSPQTRPSDAESSGI